MITSVQRLRRAILERCPLVASLSAVLVLCAFISSAFGVEPERTGLEDQFSEVAFSPRLGAAIPAGLEFLDHQGQRVRLDALLQEKPTILCLVYFRCPMLCELTADGMVRGLSRLEKSVGKDFNVLMVSFDPGDTPERAAAARQIALKRYSRDAAKDGWNVLTGEQREIDLLTDAVGFRYFWDEQTQQFAHPAGLVVLTREGKISSYLDGVRYREVELSTAIENATADKVAQQAPTNFLRCYLYDPTTGRFGTAVLWSLRIGGVLTVGSMAIGIAALSRRKKGASLSSNVAQRER